MSGIGGFLKKVGKGIGKVTSVASPLLMATGVGAPLALGVGALGGLASGHNLKETALGAVKNFALGSAGKAVAGGLKGLSGLSALSKADMLKAGAKAVPKVIGIGPNGVPLIDQTGGVGGAEAPGIGSRILGGIEGALGGRTASGGTDWGKILGTLAKGGVAAAGAYSSSKQQGQADQYRDKALKLMESEYADAAPLRQLGMQGLTDPRVRDLSSIYNTQPQQYRRLSA